MKKLFHTLLIFIGVLLAAVGVFLLIGLLSGCGTITKTKANATFDSTGVSKETSTSLSKNSTEEKSSSSWWKDSYFMPPAAIPGPTNTVTNTKLQPIIIREGGTQSMEKVHINYDSLVQAKVDSAVKSHTAAFSNKTVEGVSFKQLLLACLVSTFLTLILVWLKSKFRIVKAV